MLEQSSTGRTYTRDPTSSRQARMLPYAETLMPLAPYQGLSILLISKNLSWTGVVSLELRLCYLLSAKCSTYTTP